MEVSINQEECIECEACEKPHVQRFLFWKVVKKQNIAKIPSFHMETLREGSNSPDQIRTGA